MYFRILNNENNGELTYLLADLATREAVLIDPHGRDLPLLAAMLSERDLRLRWVLRTHHHDARHTTEPALLSRFGAPVVQGGVKGNDSEIRGREIHDRDGAVLPFGDELIHVVATPGHTPTCLSFAWRDRLFCGGLLAVAGCPHQASPLAPEALWDSVTQKVFTLPDETLLFAGYDQRARAVSTVFEQRRWHPHFSGLTRDEFLAHMTALSECPVPAPIF
jgi:glyoxylase-like metal-dependent hydrolase (beta-lactamase superfamily II)